MYDPSPQRGATLSVSATASPCEDRPTPSTSGRSMSVPMRFDLYLGSGPRRRRTMVHALALRACIARAPTTEEAIENAPPAIRARLEFLRRHGEPAADPE